jgi:hypothetical protein
MTAVSKELLASLRNSEASPAGTWPKLTENFLGALVKMWASENLSNFDYIMILNYLCGRTFSNPNHYPVLPWVSAVIS